MYRSLLPLLEQNVAALIRVLQAHDRLCCASRILIITIGGDGTEQDSPLVIDSPVEWKQYDHSAVVLRLYALYEGFVDDVIERWLDQLPGLCPYSTLPDTLRQQHRVGVAHLLNRMGAVQYEHLSLVDIVGGLYCGGSEQSNYKLPPDAFLTETRNYSWDVLVALFRNVGIDNLDGALGRDGDLSRFLTDRDSETLQSQLKNLVDLRNIAAHDEVTQTLSAGELERLAEFVVYFCRALAAIVEDASIRLLIRCGRMIECGRVINRFRERVIGIESRAHRWRVGMQLAAHHHETYRFARIETLQVNHVEHEEYDAAEGAAVAVCLDVPVSSRSKIFVMHADQPSGG